MKAIEKSYQIRENIATNRKKSIRGRKKSHQIWKLVTKNRKLWFCLLKKEIYLLKFAKKGNFFDFSI